MLLLAGCKITTTTTFDQCELDLSLSPASAERDAEIVASGGPLTEVYDTRVRFRSTDARVSDVTREGCDDCDACRDDADCTACESCPACATSCASCLQTATFTVPGIAPGETEVVITNRFGSSPPLPFTVLSADSGDSGDSGL